MQMISCSSHNMTENSEQSTLTEKQPDIQTQQSNPQSNSYKALVVGFSDSTGLELSVEYDIEDHETYKDKKIDDTVSVTIAGEEVSGIYAETKYQRGNYFPVYGYRSKLGYFQLDPNGKLVLCSWNDSELVSDDPVRSEEECVQIAKDFLSTIVDTEPYKVESYQSENYYVVEFNKYIGDMKVKDSATVTVTRSGQLSSFSSSMLGTIPNDVVNMFDMVEAERVFRERLDQILMNSNFEFDRFEYNEMSLELMLLKDGSYGLLCTADVDGVIEFEGGDHAKMGQIIKFVVTA